MSIPEIRARVADFHAPYVVVTGGEPMIAPGIVELSRELRSLNMHITFETAGTVFHPVECDLMSISPKLSNSTPEGPFQAQHERLRVQPQVLNQLIATYDYQLKFVIARPEDLAEVQELVTVLQADPRKIILMPEGISSPELHQRSLWLAELCKQTGYRYSPRLHVDLWGNRRGI